MINVLFLITLFLPILTFASAGEKTMELTRYGAVQYALAHNYNLKAVKTGIDAAKGRTQNAGLLANPELSAEYGNDLAFKNEGEYAMKFEISQRFPLFGRLSKEKAVGQIDILLAESEHENEARLLANQVEIEYISILQKIAEIKLKKTLLAEISKLEKELEQSQKWAEASPIDSARVKGERVKLDVEIMEASVGLESAISQFRVLLALDPNVKIEFVDNLKELPISAQKYSADVLESRPDWKMFELASKNADAQIALEKAGRYEDVAVGIFYESAYEDDDPVGKKHERALGVSISIPLPFNMRSGSINEKLALRRQAESKAIALENRIKNEIALYRKQSKNYSEILAKQNSELESVSRDVHEQTLFARSQGQASISDLIDVWKNTLDVAIMKTQLISKQAQSATMLNYCLGVKR